MSPTAWTKFESACRANPPRGALVLGSGMGPVASRVEKECEVAFLDVPDFPTSSVSGHRGTISLGTFSRERVLLFEGRLHFYEGLTWDDVTKPMVLAQSLACEFAVLTSAVGGIRPEWRPGTLVSIRDHFEWNHPFAWLKPEPGGLAPRTESPYSQRLHKELLAAATTENEEVQEGIYASMTGPNYETPAEVCALASRGADVVGMSTTREVQKGAELGMEMLVIACVANAAAGVGTEALSHHEVLEVVSKKAEALSRVLARFFQDRSTFD